MKCVAITKMEPRGWRGKKVAVRYIYRVSEGEAAKAIANGFHHVSKGAWKRTRNKKAAP